MHGLRDWRILLCGDLQARIGEEYTSALESRYLFDDLVSFPVVILGRPPTFVYTVDLLYNLLVS